VWEVRIDHASRNRCCCFQDAHNCKGGKVIFRVQKAVANFYWEELVCVSWLCTVPLCNPVACFHWRVPALRGRCCWDDSYTALFGNPFCGMESRCHKSRTKRRTAVSARLVLSVCNSWRSREGIRAQLRLPAGLLDYKAHETHPLLQHLATQQPPPRPVPSGSANNSSSTSSSAASSLPPPPTVAPPPPPSQQAPAIPTSPPPPPTVPPATTAAGEKNGPPSAAAAPPAEKA